MNEIRNKKFLINGIVKELIKFREDELVPSKKDCDEVIKLEKELLKYKAEKEKHLLDQNFEKAANARNKEREIKNKLSLYED